MHPVQQARYAAGAARMAQFSDLTAADFQADGLIDPVEFCKSSLKLEAIPAPGHSPDSVCFYSPLAKFLICGDVLFQANTGRVDLPGGSAEQLKRSIEALSKLEIEYLLPGHGDIVAGGDAVKQNFQYIRENVLSWL
jgi:glyoxylase-like metal-dependent hydrolase (beta-lactamase superfamily II)